MRENVVSKAELKHFRTSPRKARLVLDLIRGKQVEPALTTLKFAPQKTAQVAHKLLMSAVANAQESGSADVDKLWVVSARVDPGRILRRYMPRAHGRASPIRKRSCHLVIEVGYRV